MKIVIMRGLPGAGKDTYLQSRYAGQSMLVCSADDYHMVGKEYKFDPRKVGSAHDQCLEKFLHAALNQYLTWDVLAVSNTNTTLIELAPYMRVATALRIEYTIVYLLCGLGTSMKRNVHDVPPNTILGMYRNLITEIVPPYWNQEVVYEQ